MRNAITYKDLYLSLGKVISIEELKVVQKPNRHGELRLLAVLDCEPDEISYYELPDTVTVNYMDDGEEQILFKGIITDSSMKRVGEHMQIRLKAYDATWSLDKTKRTRSFQNTKRTNHSVIEEIMKDYPECICMKNIPEEAIGQIWFQYEETDWEFLCRFVSRYAESLYADATYEAARFQAGLSPENIEVKWEECPYRMGKDLEQYDILAQNGFADLEPIQFVEYFIDSYDLYTLGSRLTYRNKEWYIGSLERNLREGLLVCTYELKQKEAMSAVRKYSKRITGISVDGKIIQVNRDKVRVTINNDLTTEQGTYWFPFSTVAASSDGSGWYSMPETGDSIRVYFPTKDEKEAYVITKHDSHMPATPGTGGGASGGSSGGGSSSGSSSSGGGGSSGGGSSGGGSSGGSTGGGGSSGGAGGAAAAGISAAMAAAGAMDAAKEKEENPMDDPKKRNIFTKDGNKVQMVPSGVLLSAGKSSITLLKSGKVMFNAPMGITINAGKQLSVSGENVTLEAGTAIELKGSKGSTVRIIKKNINIHAKEIYEN
ncbi:MAG: hypothetical protein J1F42_12045 [Lachnospiraceae bacterium]|nr:hypothetical protein [Lachnospiraceae bacterium]